MTNSIVLSRADDPATLRARLRWVQLYQQTGDAGLTCRRCGISRPTLRKWSRRYQESGDEGLRSRSRRRKQLPPPKLSPAEEQRIVSLREKRRLGPKRLQTELERLDGLHLSTDTIWQVLNRHGVSASLRPRRRIKAPKRYSRPIPGDRIQIDSCKIRKGLYQFTAIDDCTRMRVLGLYPDRKQLSAIRFVQEKVLPGFAFPIQRIQTDRGSEFIGDGFQTLLRQEQIKFRPTPPRSPHLNGKVERSQQTDRIEFWATIDTSLPTEDLTEPLAQWEQYYNTERWHSGLAGKTPEQRYQETASRIPTAAEVRANFDMSKEKWQQNRYWSWVYDPPKDRSRPPTTLDTT